MKTFYHAFIIYFSLLYKRRLCIYFNIIKYFIITTIITTIIIIIYNINLDI